MEGRDNKNEDHVGRNSDWIVSEQRCPRIYASAIHSASSESNTFGTFLG